MSVPEMAAHGEVGRSRQHPAAVIATLLLLLALTFHFFVTWLYLTPTNPVKIVLWRDIHAYMHPLFAQNWQLFAPTPVADNQMMLVQARLRDRATGAVTISKWVDVTTPVMQQIHEHRVGPMSKLARPFSGVFQTVTYGDPVLGQVRARMTEAVLGAYETARLEERRRGLTGKAADSASARARVLLPQLRAVLDSVRAPTPDERMQRRLGREMLYRLASAFAKKAFPEHEVLAVNARYVRQEFPRFSGRKLAANRGTVQHGRPFGWEPVRAVTLP
jgi:hypothetical protein